MRIFSKHALKFHDPAGEQEPVRVGSGEFKDVPDWVKKSTMFLLAAGHEIVSVIEGKSDEVKAEKAAEKKTAKPEDAKADSK